MDSLITILDYFENPLLLSIMLITYQDSALIPVQLHNFYSSAFDALFFRHDATKAGFRRPTKTEMDIDVGRRIKSNAGSTIRTATTEISRKGKRRSCRIELGDKGVGKPLQT